MNQGRFYRELVMGSTISKWLSRVKLNQRWKSLLETSPPPFFWIEVYYLLLVLTPSKGAEELSTLKEQINNFEPVSTLMESDTVQNIYKLSSKCYKWVVYKMQQTEIFRREKKKSLIFLFKQPFIIACAANECQKGSLTLNCSRICHMYR